jgi:hypothetical protein
VTACFFCSRFLYGQRKDRAKRGHGPKYSEFSFYSHFTYTNTFLLPLTTNYTYATLTVVPVWAGVRVCICFFNHTLALQRPTNGAATIRKADTASATRIATFLSPQRWAEKVQVRGRRRYGRTFRAAARACTNYVPEALGAASHLWVIQHTFVTEAHPTFRSSFRESHCYRVICRKSPPDAAHPGRRDRCLP